MAHYKSIFISDIHLGSRAYQADILCNFLKNNTSDNLFLVGDIIDGWRLKKRWYWPQSHTNDIVEENINGALNSDLHIAVEKALKVSRTNTYYSSLIWTWENCYKQFKESLPKI